MAGDQTDSGAESDRDTKLRDDAIDLIGTHRLWSGQCLYAAVKLGILDALDDDPTAAEAIASDLGLHPENCYRLLRALAHFGVLAEGEDRRFTLEPVGRRFAPDHPDSVRNLLLLDRNPAWVRPMHHLGAVVEEGSPTGFDREFDMDFFEYTETHPEFGDHFNAWMSDRSRRESGPIVDALAPVDFPEDAHVCDIGGGHGHLLGTFLEAHPNLSGTVLDLPGVVSAEDRLWAPKLGVDDRLEYAAGDMFEAVPPADAYFLKFILHDWADEDCETILSTIHDAAPPDGRLFIVELVVPGPGTSHFSKRLDLTMMVHLGGRERTEAEYAALLERSGWTLADTWHPTEAPLSVLECRTA